MIFADQNKSCVFKSQCMGISLTKHVMQSTHKQWDMGHNGCQHTKVSSSTEMESNGDIVQLNKTEIQPENIVILIYTISIHFIPWCSQWTWAYTTTNEVGIWVVFKKMGTNCAIYQPIVWNMYNLQAMKIELISPVYLVLFVKTCIIYPLALW